MGPSSMWRVFGASRGFDAAVQKCSGVLAGVLVAVTATGGVVVMSSAKLATPAAQEPANTVKVERGKLSSMVSLMGP